jgi:hypothetical protein
VGRVVDKMGARHPKRLDAWVPLFKELAPLETGCIQVRIEVLDTKDVE